MKKPLTQSKKWTKLQEDLGDVPHLETGNGFSFLAIEKHTRAGNYLFLPYGPVCDSEEGFERALTSLRFLAASTKAIFVRIEPQSEAAKSFLEAGNHSADLPFRQILKVRDIDPADTWVLDLDQDESTIISGFSQGTRTRYNTYEKKGLRVTSVTDPDEIIHLVALQKKLYQKKHLNAFSEHYLKTELKQPFASLYLVRYLKSHDMSRRPDAPAGNYPRSGQIIAASLFFDFDGTRYYMQSAADTDYKRLPATVALLTKAIFDAKKQGIKHFDFWGIAPEGAPKNHPWAGFTDFKKSFGGHAVHYAGTYDLVIKPIRYRIFKFLKRLKHSH